MGSDAPTSDAATARPGEGNASDAHEPEGLWGQIGQTVGDLGRGISQEGIGGLFDPAGMLDRQQAQRDLSNRFQVVGDDFVGPRNHNQVTQEEYEEIARTYSNVRMGRGDLTINTDEMSDEDAAEYRSSTMNSIADMMMTTAGRDQVMQMSNNVLVDDAGNPRLDADGDEQHRHTTIRAVYNGAQYDGDPLDNPLDQNRDGVVDENDDYSAANRIDWNAYADAVDGADRGDWYRTPDGSGGTNRGAGTDTNIWWNPDLNVDQCTRQDVILAHEMQHALHETQGTMADGTHSGARDAAGNPLDPDEGLSNFERQAVGLPNSGHYPGDPDGCTENTYREQRNQLGLGERLLPRDSYNAGVPGEATSDAELQRRWEQYHRTNPDAF